MEGEGLKMEEGKKVIGNLKFQKDGSRVHSLHRKRRARSDAPYLSNLARQ